MQSPRAMAVLKFVATVERVAAITFLLFLGLCALLLVGGLIYLRSIGFDAAYDPDTEVRTGEVARSILLSDANSGRSLRQLAGVGFPPSAKNFWVYDGGNFNGSIVYGRFDCESREDCLEAVRTLGGLRPDELKPWKPSRYAVVMEGLDFYAKHWAIKIRDGHRWDVRGIVDGVVYEHADDEHRGMIYYAIDFGRNRVYYHRESGGFPPDEYPRRPNPRDAK